MVNHPHPSPSIMLNLLCLSSKLSINFGKVRNKTLWSLLTISTIFFSILESWCLYLHTCNYEHNGFKIIQMKISIREKLHKLIEYWSISYFSKVTHIWITNSPTPPLQLKTLHFEIVLIPLEDHSFGYNDTLITFLWKHPNIKPKW